jgi:quercetin dioxygenase-like cupin family protein
MKPYIYIEHIAEQIESISPDTIVSRTLSNTPDLKVILFGFAPGQELSEHTSTHPAILHFLRGQAKVTLGQDTFAATAGTFAAIPPQMPHSIYAETEVIMLLLLTNAKRP